ncbi:MAG: 2-oxopent-4-enoate hydratase [Alphaproteobacteria bacterium]
MDTKQINKFGDELFDAVRSATPVLPLTERDSSITIEDAYKIQERVISRRLKDGEEIVGWKIGVTSKAVMNMLNVNQPDFGHLLSGMVYGDGDVLPTNSLLQPRAEGEIAFILKKDLAGPGVTAADVIAATDFVMPCFEIVDSRIKDWKIKIQDTISDNASSGLFVLGGTAVGVDEVDLGVCGMVLEKNGEIVATGAGAAALGSSPVSCVVWLANMLGSLGITLRAGEVILSGSLVPLVPAQAGDHLRVEVGGIGSASVRFEE